MANNNETTTKFRVDISELKTAMQEARKQVAYANSEFKATSSSLDNWSKSSDGISAKLKQLNSNLKSQETVLNQYEKTLEEVKKEYGENSTEALEWATKLNNQKAIVNKTKSEIEKFEGALSEVSEAEKIASKSGKDVAEVLDDIHKESKNASDGFTVFKGAIANFVGNGLTALADGLKDAVGNLINLASETREYREDMAKLDTAFQTAGFSTEQASKVYKDFYAVLGEEDRSVEAVNHLAKLVDTEKDMQTWTDICTGVWATFGDSLPIEGLTEAANETAKTGQLTGVLADSLNWAGQSEDEFQAKLDSLNSEQERAAFITETLNGLYSSTADEYRKNNKSVMEANRVQSDYTDTLATMGEKIEPLTTTVKQGVTELLKEFLKLVEDVDMEAFTSKIEEGFGVLKDDVLPAIKEGLGWIIKNKDILVTALVSIASGFVAFKVVGTVTSLITAVKNLGTGLTLLKGIVTALGGPVAIIITVVASLVAGFIHLWKTSDEFRAFWINLWEVLKNALLTAGRAIGTFFTETLPNFFKGVIDWIKNNWQSILTFLVNPFAGLFKYFYDNNSKFREFVDNAVNQIKQMPAKVWTWLLNTIAKVVQWRIDLGQKAREAGQELLNKLIDKVKEIPAKVKSIGGDIVAGLWNGISDKVKWLKDKISGFVGDVTDWLKDKFGIHSPSKLMADEIGRWLPEGIAVGISDNAKSTVNAMNDLVSDTVGGARNGLRSATSTLGSGVVGGAVNNYTQIINSPRALNRLDIYRQSKNLLGYAGGGI